MIILPNNIDFDPGLMELESISVFQYAEGTRLWAKHFAPLGSNVGIVIPRCWGDFFSQALLNPSNFAWAKALLESKAWNMIIKEGVSEDSITFSIPKNCPSKGPIFCSNQETFVPNDNQVASPVKKGGELQALPSPPEEKAK
jgi:hypothetical protein